VGERRECFCVHAYKWLQSSVRGGGERLMLPLSGKKGVIFVSFYTFFMERSKPDYDEISRPV